MLSTGLNTGAGKHGNFWPLSGLVQTFLAEGYGKVPGQLLAKLPLTYGLQREMRNGTLQKQYCKCGVFASSNPLRETSCGEQICTL